MGNKHFNYSKQFKKEAAVEEVVQDTNVDPVNEPVSDVVKPPKMGIVINCDKLRLRAQPEGEVMKTINKGENVAVLDMIGDWYKVNVRGVNGYCMTQFIELQ